MGRTSFNSNITGMNCIRCGALHPIADYFEGCPACLAEGFPASVAPYYEAAPSRFDRHHPEAWLAYPGGPFLGEGRTPLIALPQLANKIGVQSLFAKNEGANPTGSHKDRMSALLFSVRKKSVRLPWQRRLAVRRRVTGGICSILRTTMRSCHHAENEWQLASRRRNAWG